MQTATVKTWEKTKRENLVRHKSGRYYARLFLNGKEIWKSLKTSHFSIAESRLTEVVKEHRAHRSIEPTSLNAKLSAKMTFADAAKLHLSRVDEDVNLKRGTRLYSHDVLASLLKSWPELAATEIRRITPAVCREWAARYAKDYSATRFNGALSLLRRIISVAIECGVVHSNPAIALKRKSVRAKKLELPTAASLKLL